MKTKLIRLVSIAFALILAALEPAAAENASERCPSACAAQAQSPNGDYAADAMVSWLAHALNAVVTNPMGDGWYDRYGLENSEKCEGTYGTTYTVTNQNGQSALANIKLGYRHYLLQQNWVNGKKGHCAMSVSQ
jgi:hypothetical protein